MKRHHDNERSAGGPASTATREDLALAVRLLGQAETLKAEAVAALARVQARGDGEAAVGMPVDQHLRWATNLRRGAVSTIQVITDVAAELPTVMAAHAAGRVNLDQVAAIAWPAAKVPRDLRRALDASLAEGDGWMRLDPDSVAIEVARLLEELAPARTERQERLRAQRQFLHLQPTLDGQGLKWWGNAVGVDAALIDATLRAASDRPVPATPDPDGVLVGTGVRDNQLFTGLLTIFHGWAAGTGAGPGHNATDAGSSTDDVRDATGAHVTIYAIVDERDGQPGTGEVVMASRGLAPRLTAAEVARLRQAGARTIKVFAVDGEIVAVDGRAGHAIHDPAGLSEETTRILCTVRDRTCRAPGCDRPAEHLHHLVWQSWPGCTDDPSNRVWLCTRCHHRVVHRWRWTGTVGALGHLTWTRPQPTSPTGPAGIPTTTTSTVGRLARRLPRPPPPVPEPDRDQFGDLLPF